MTSEFDTRLRDDPDCPLELRAGLADWDGEWPDAAQLSRLRESIRDHFALEEQLPRLRSPASGTTAHLRGALESDFEELPTAIEIAELRRRIDTSLGVANPPERRFARRIKRPWLRTLLVAALIALPAAAAAFVGYRLVVARRAAHANSSHSSTIGRSTTPPLAPMPAPSATATATATSTEPVPSQRPKPGVAQRKAAEGGAEPSEFDLIGQARARMASSPAEALRLVERHARLFPSGVLTQERELIAIESLERLGRDADARARAQRFAKRFPGSAHLPRLIPLLAPDPEIQQSP